MSPTDVSPTHSLAASRFYARVTSGWKEHRTGAKWDAPVGLLVQRQVPAYGHCVFTPAQLGAAFADFILWVESGIKPTP